MIASLSLPNLLAQVPVLEANAVSGFFLVGAIVVPLLLGAFCLLYDKLNAPGTKMIATVAAIFPVISAVYLYAAYLKLGAEGYAFYIDIPIGLERILGISLKLGLNGISLPFFMLSAIVGLAAILYAAQTPTAKKVRGYLGLLLVMLGGIMGIFASIDVFFFYLFHEVALIPTALLIVGWGGRQRIAIALEMAIYLTLGAMLSLAGLIMLYVNSGAESFDLIALQASLAQLFADPSWGGTAFGLLLFGFGILVSLFPFHTWAPKTYGAAPTAAAMLHAGVLKKFGLFGLLQIAAPLLPEAAGSWQSWLVVLALGNVLIIGLITLAQKDLKQVVAYGSVMHMGYAFLGIATLSVLGTGGAVLMLVAHGLSVALLFLLATSVHHRTSTFMIPAMGGLMHKAPVLAFSFAIAIFASIGLPGLANFWGELAIFVSLWDFSPWVAFLAILGIIISAVYGLRAFTGVFLGDAPEESAPENPVRTGDLVLSEKIPAFLLIGCLLIVGFWPRTLTEPIQRSLPESPSTIQTAAPEPDASAQDDA